MDINDAGMLIEAAMSGESLPTVDGAELARAWEEFRQNWMESRRGGPERADLMPAVLIRCVILSELQRRGIELSGLVIQAVATKPFSSNYTLESLLRDLS